ncbi:sugar ABC transporter substrate-binding protein [Agathobaculum sp. NTUH-O15-33]|uniref:sugar ABC transporter substrate-binding protein n=1 Tax=Agathobaculum sp. NTUH-O15-33 TaxID=3079302 RepID=UPI0029585CFD|nr:sugar ABC transporter substrate-binding protein [Agathobaculum sp. NTUH-O15-33]WNX85438.1 sugar ABC transporter substrate-binding protein [Agathobaculum sp. NTUH-O15-33]
MKKGKGLLSMLTASALLMGVLAGCGGAPDAKGEASADGGPAEGGKNVSAILMSLNSDYWHMIESGVINGGSDFGMDVTITAPTNEADVTGQIAMIEDQITAGANGLVLAPCDTKAVLPALEKCKESGIPVVLIDMDLDEENRDLRATFIGSSEYAAGEMVGQYIVDNFEPCKIAVIRGLAGLPSHDARAGGMRDTVTAKGFEVVTEQPADSERGKAVNVAENIMESTPDVKIIYCTNDEMALGAYQAVEGQQKTDEIFIIGFDGSPDALKSIKDGKLGASLAQKPIEMGFKGVEALQTLLDGGTVDSTIYTSTQIVDASNVETFEADLNAQMEKAAAAAKK